MRPGRLYLLGELELGPKGPLPGRPVPSLAAAPVQRPRPDLRIGCQHPALPLRPTSHAVSQLRGPQVKITPLTYCLGRSEYPAKFGFSKSRS